MKKIYLLICTLLCSFSLQAQLTNIVVETILEPANACAAGSQAVKVRLRNTGVTGVSGDLKLRYRLDAGSWSTEETYTLPLTGGGNAIDYTFAALVTIPIGSSPHSIEACVRPSFPGTDPYQCTIRNNIFNYAVIANYNITSSQVICTGSDPAILDGQSPTGGNSVYTYEWQRSTNSALGPWDPNIASSEDFDPPITTQTTWYRRITSSVTCTPSTSNVVEITVQQNISNNTISSAQTICEASVPSGLTGTLPANGSGTYTYQWQSSITDGVSGFGNIGGANIQNYSPGALTQTTWYRRVITAGACPSDISPSIQITVRPALGNNTVSSAQTICTGNTPVGLDGATASGGTGTYVYQWESSITSAVAGFGNATGASTNEDYAPGLLTQTTWYRRSVSSMPCTAIMSAAVQITVEQNIGNNSISSAQTICTGSAPSGLTGTNPTGGSGTYAYTWESSITGPSSGFSSVGITTRDYSPGALTQNTWYIRRVNSGACNSSTSAEIAITVNNNISNNTISAAQTICVNTAPSTLNGLLPSGGNGTYSYQWQSSITDGVSGFTDIGSANSQNYSPGILSQTTWYRRVVTAGICPSHISPSIEITVRPAVANNTISSAQTICTGTTPVALDGTIPTGGTGTYAYQWESSITSAVAGFGNATGVSTNEDYTPGVLTQNTWYRRSASSTPCAANISPVIQITVEQNIGNNTISAAQLICTGSTPNGLIGSDPTSGNGTYTYIWESSITGPSAGFSPIGVTTRDYSPGALTQTTWYIRRVNSGVCNTSTSAEIAITVNANISNNSISSDQTICTGAVPAALGGSVPANGNGAYTYFWEKSTVSAVAGFGPASGVNTNQNYSPPSLTQTTWFRRIVSSPPCISNTSSVIEITVDQNVTNNTLSANQVICNAETPATLVGNLPSGGNGSFSYQWEISTTSPGISGYTDIVGATAIDYSPGSLTQNTWYRRKVISGACAPAGSPSVSAALQVTVNPVIANNSITTADQTVCETIAPSNLNASFPAGGDGTYTYLWESSTTSAVAGFSPAAGTNNTQNYTPGILTQNTWFRRVVMSASCVPLTSAVVKVTVDNLPVGGNVSPVDQTVCSTANNGILNLLGYLGDVYRWQNSTDGGISWADIGVTTVNHTFNNLAGPATYQFRVGVKNGVCTNEIFSASASVDVQNQTDAGEVSSDTVCNGSSGTLTLQGHNGSVVRWERSTNGINWETFGATGTTETYSNITLTTQYRVYVNDGLCPGTTSQIGIINVDQPSAGGDLSHPNPVCAGSNTSSIILGTHTGTIQDWEYSADGVLWNSTGVVSNPYIVANLSATRQYRAVVKNGVCPINNSDTTIVVVSPNSVGGSVSGGGPICSGTNVTLTLGPHTGNLTDWEFSNDNGTNWNSTGISSNPYNIGSPAASIYYRAVVKSGVCAPANSGTAIISVTQPSIGGFIAGGGANLCSGANSGTLNLNSYNGTIQDWEVSSDGGTSWSSLSLSSNAYNYNNITAAIPTTNIYRAIVKSGACAAAISATATLSITPATVGGSISGGGITVCSGSNSGTLTLSGHTGSILRWERSDDGVAWNNIANTSTSLNYFNINQTYSYRAVVQSGGCSITTSAVVILNVSTPTLGGAISGGGATLCSGSNSGVLNLGSYNGTIQDWEVSSDGGVSWASMSNTSNSYNYNNLTAAVPISNIYRAIVKSGTCPAETSATAILNITPATLGGSIAGGGTTICSGSNSGTLTLSGHIGNVLRWERSDDGIAWNNIANTGNSLNYFNISQTYYYRAVVQSGACEILNSPVATLNVSTATLGGVIAGGGLTLCSGSNTGALNLNSYNGTIQDWEISNDGGASWLSLFNNSSSYNYNNLSSGSPITNMYRAIVKSGACPAETSVTANLNITPATVGGVIDGGGITVCSGNNSGVLTLNGYVGNVLRWERSNDGVVWNTIVNTSNFLNYSNINQTYYYRGVVQSGSCAVLNSSVDTLNVSTATSGGNAIASQPVVCSGSSVSIYLVNQVGNVLNWNYSIDNGISWNMIASTNSAITFSVNVPTQFYANVQSCNPAVSTTVTVNPDQPSVGGVLSGNASHCGSVNSGVISLSGNTGSVLRWEASTDNEVSWSNISQTNSIHNYSNLTVSTNFRAVIQSGVCPVSYSSSASILITPATEKGIIAGPSSVCSGSNGTINITDYVGSIQQWEFSIDNGLTWMVDSTNTSGTFNFTNLLVSSQFKALIQGCTPEYSDIQSVIVNPVAIGGQLTGSAVICAGANSGTLSLSNNVGTDLQWEFSEDDGNTWIEFSNSGNTYNYLNLEKNTRYRVLSKSGECSEEYSSVALLNIPLPAYVNYITGDATVCSVNNGGIISLVDYRGVIEQWESSVDDGATWDTIPNNSPFHTFNNIMETTLFHAKVKMGDCSAVTSEDVKIKVNEKPQADIIVPEVIKAEVPVSFTDNSSIGEGNINLMFWDFGDGKTESGKTPSHTYAFPGTYTVMLLVMSDAGCMDSSIIDIEVKKADKFQVSNLMTLNENGLNDTWYVEGIEAYPESEVHIYNRFGSEIYSAKPYLNDWNGTYKGSLLPDGTYYYILKLSPNGLKYNGTITIVK